MKEQVIMLKVVPTFRFCLLALIVDVAMGLDVSTYLKLLFPCQKQILRLKRLVVTVLEAAWSLQED